MIEVMIVVVILGIAAAIVVPQLGTRDDLKVSAAARAVMADLMYAQNRAIATQKKHYVEFSGSNYTLLARDSDASALYTLTNPVTKGSYTVTIGAANTSFTNVQIGSTNFDSATRHAIQFDSLGAPSSYNVAADTAAPLVNTGTIELQTTAGTFPLSVLIDSSTGEASIH